MQSRLREKWKSVVDQAAGYHRHRRLGKDGGLFAGTHDGRLYAISPDMEIT